MYILNLWTVLIGLSPTSAALASEPCNPLTSTQCGHRARAQPAVAPSMLSPELAWLDARNPLRTDAHHVAMPAETGIRSLDSVARLVARVEAAVTLAEVAQQAHRRNRPERAARIASGLLPVLDDMQGDLVQIGQQLGRIDPSSLDLSRIDLSRIDLPSLLRTGTRAVDAATVVRELGVKLQRLRRQLPEALQAMSELATDRVGAVAGTLHRRTTRK